MCQRINYQEYFLHNRNIKTVNDWSTCVFLTWKRIVGVRVSKRDSSVGTCVIVKIALIKSLPKRKKSKMNKMKIHIKTSREARRRLPG